MQSLSGSYRNLQALINDGNDSEEGQNKPLAVTSERAGASRTSLDSADTRKQSRFVFVSNHLPIRCKRSADDSCWEFEWDEDALIAQAQEGVGEGFECVYVGSLPVEVELAQQEEVALDLVDQFNCYVVFMGEELKEKYYKGFCKQQLWPLFHYFLPLSPTSPARYDPELWQAYVRANKVFADKLVEVVTMDEDFVWIHDYHLLALPSLLRKKYHRIRLGLFLHCPFPSSEIYRTFPRREDLLRSILNADIIGFHTFDYARHFLSCCSRMLGLEHITKRGSIMVEYYGRHVGVKIMPTGIKPERLLSGFGWEDTIWRRGELLSQFEGQRVLLGNDDMDLFKGIELKLQAFERVLKYHPEWQGKLVLVQITNAPRSPGKDIQDLHDYILALVERINKKYAMGTYKPIVWLDRQVPLYERIALYSVADVAVVTATRDGMNLVPYEYIACRQGPQGKDGLQHSMLVVSEFVGCSPSLSGAIRVNPWSINSVADGIYAAIKLPLLERQMRHEKHWRYVSQHTASYWAASFSADLQRITKKHSKMKCYVLGLGLDSFKIVALTENFRKLEPISLMHAYQRAAQRVFLLDYDGTLVPHSDISSRPTPEILGVLSSLCAHPRNQVYIISGRSREELSDWFSSVPRLGLAAEHGFYFRPNTDAEWEERFPHDVFAWKEMVLPILEVYTESTDGSHIEAKESALVWHYKNTDPDFGHWQAKELLDHLEGVLSNEPVEVTAGQSIVEVKPQGVSKGGAVERILNDAAKGGTAPDFVLCIGDDRSDEDMFTSMQHVTFSPHMPAEVFACTVGQKPSKAPFYVNDVAEVASLLARLTDTPPRVTSLGLTRMRS